MFRNVHISKMLRHTSASKCHMCNMVCTWSLFRSYCLTTCITWPPPWVLFGDSVRQQLVRKVQAQYIISYPLFADVDTGIYPHAALQYHARPQAKRGIVILIVDKFQYPRQQTRVYRFIPCANDVCYILKRFQSFKFPANSFIWPKSLHKRSVIRSHHSGKRWMVVVIAIVTSAMTLFIFISHADDVESEICVHTSGLLAKDGMNTEP